jgi:hypothetical protein
MLNNFVSSANLQVALRDLQTKAKTAQQVLNESYDRIIAAVQADRAHHLNAIDRHYNISQSDLAGQISDLRAHQMSLGAFAAKAKDVRTCSDLQVWWVLFIIFYYFCFNENPRGLSMSGQHYVWFLTSNFFKSTSTC